VKLPVGLSASPFTEGTDSPAEEGLKGAKIAPNLKTVDAPESAAVQEAKKVKVKGDLSVQ